MLKIWTSDAEALQLKLAERYTLPFDATSLVSEVSWHEMRRRWALGELDSEFFELDKNHDRENIRMLLESDNIAMQQEGILRHKKRIQIWNSFPSDTTWVVVRLNMTERFWGNLYTVNDIGWGLLSNGSYRLTDAALNTNRGVRIDPRVSRVIEACKENRLSLKGMTFLSTRGSSCSTVAEGTARLIALYLDFLHGNHAESHGRDIEVVLGLSDSQWQCAVPC